MGKANWWYNAKERRWEIRNRAGSTIASFSDDGLNRDHQGAVVDTVGSIADGRIQRLRVGGGATLSYVDKHTATLPSVAVGTGLSTHGTLTGLGSAGIAVGDLVFVNAKVASLGNVLFGGARIPTTNVVNVFLTNPNQADIGSIAHVGVDVLRVRF